MTDKSGEFVDFGGLDPAVAAIIRQGERRQGEAHLPVEERRKKRQEREKARARLPRRVNWDLTEELKQRIKNLAEEEGVPTSQLAVVLLTEGLARLEAGEIDLEAYKERSESPRYKYRLVLPENGQQVGSGKHGKPD